MTQHLELGQFATILRGTTPAHTVDHDGGPVFIGQTEVVGGLRAPRRYVDTLRKVERSVPVLLQLGDVVFAAVDRSHRALVIGQTLQGAYLGRECLAVRFPHNFQKLSPEFLAVWARSDDFQRQAEMLMTGTTMPRLTHRALASMVVPVLTSERQSRVAEVAGKIDAATTALQVSLDSLTVLEGLELELAFLEDADA